MDAHALPSWDVYVPRMRESLGMLTREAQDPGCVHVSDTRRLLSACARDAWTWEACALGCAPERHELLSMRVPGMHMLLGARAPGRCMLLGMSMPGGVRS